MEPLREQDVGSGTRAQLDGATESSYRIVSAVGSLQARNPGGALSQQLGTQ